MSRSASVVDLEGRVAIVTGGSAGIGRAIAAALAGAGASVALTSRDAERAEEVATELADDDGRRVIGLPCDVRDPASCEGLVRGTTEELGGLDIVVNNAGIGIFKSFQEMSHEEWRAQVDTNLHGVFNVSKAALPALLESGRGGEGDAWIVNVGSLASRNSFGKGAGYNASKFGLLGMTEAMMIDLRYEGIRTAIVMPGSVDTEFGGNHDERGWAIDPADVGLAVLQLMAQPKGTLVSRIEMRPTRPPRR